METEGELLFVYGTLQSGRPAHALMRLRRAEYIGEARLHGYALYDLFYYPGIVPDDTESVLGEVYRVSDAALATLDLYECEGSLFTRRVADVSLTGSGNIKAFIYVYNKAVTTRARIPMTRQPWRMEG